MNKFVEKLKTFILSLNERGVPVPLARDPDKDGPSVTLTMMLIASCIAAGGLVGKFTKVLGEVDVSGANYLFLTASGLYLGRKMTGNKNETTIEKDEKSNEETPT